MPNYLKVCRLFVFVLMKTKPSPLSRLLTSQLLFPLNNFLTLRGMQCQSLYNGDKRTKVTQEHELSRQRAMKYKLCTVRNPL